MNIVDPVGNLIQANSDPAIESETALYGRLETELAANLLTADNSSSTNLSLGDSEDNNTSGLKAGPSSRLSIASKPQHELTPDLSDLRKSQDLHNRLSTAVSGLNSLSTDLLQLADNLQNHSSNNGSAKILNNIDNTISTASYNNQHVFNKKPVEILPQTYNIQQTIIASKESVSDNGEGEYLTKGNEAFILANSKSRTLYSFPSQTPLEEINQTISDYTADAGIHPLFYVENQISGTPQVISKDAEGISTAKSDLTLTPIDGELFSRPIHKENPAEARISGSTLTVKLVEDNDNISLSESTPDNSISNTISFTENVTEGEIDNENVRLNNQALTRSINFNQLIDRERKQGDGFAITPEKKEQPIPPHVIEQQQREEIAAIEANKDNPGSNTTNNPDIILIPKESPTPPQASAPYVTLQEREYGITAQESAYQTDKIFLTAVETKNTDLENNRQQPIPVNDSESAIQPTAAISPVNQSEQSFTGFTGNSEQQQEQTTQEEQQSNNSENNQNIITTTAINADNENYSEINNIETPRPENNNEEGREEQIRSDNSSITREEAISNNNVPLLNSDRNITEAEFNSSEKSLQTSGNTPEQTANNRTEERRTGITNPAEQLAAPAASATELLENINSVVRDTLNFTLRGNRGSLDYVFKAGNTNDTVALTVNATQYFTGVTATANQKNVTLQGELTGQLNEARTNTVLTQNAETVNQETPAVAVQQNNDDNQTLTINLSELGRTEKDGEIYSLDSLSQLLTENTPVTADDRESLPTEIIDNALNEITALQGNLQSLSSLNQRNVDYISQQINEKLLPESARSLTENSRPADIEQALNLVAVGISNSTSAAGGTGIGTDPLASLHLLSPTPTVADNRSEPLQQQNLENITQNPTAYSLANMEALSSYNISSINTSNHLHSQTDPEKEQPPIDYSAVTTELAAGREELENLQEMIRKDNTIFDNHIELVEEAADRFFQRIENAKLTIREAGREFEATENVETLQKERFAQMAYNLKSYDQQQEEEMTLEAEAIDSTAEQLRIDSQEFSKKDFHELLENIGQALGNRIAEYTADQTPAEILNLQQQMTAPASAAFTGATDSAPVVTTRATQTNTLTSTAREHSYKNLSTIIDGKLGNVMVHGQDYTLSDLHENDWQPEDASDTTEVATSVLEKAIAELELAENLSNELAAGELLDKGSDINGAINSYGSDLSNTTPAVASYTAQIQSQARL